MGQQFLFNHEEIETVGNPRSIKLLDLCDYDSIIVSYSGGKDSLACLLYLLSLGIPKEKIILWHQCVDGAPDAPYFMDWPCTPAYVEVTGAALGIKAEFQWRENGFRGELLRRNSLTNSVSFTLGDNVVNLPTLRGKATTRLKFPAKTADLSRRWCSAYLKIDVFRRVLNNHPDYQQGKILVITGERREESAARSHYLEAEIHPCDRRGRLVHWARTVIDWEEARVWEQIADYKIMPHPAYQLGWNRTSCFGCIFSTPDLWAMMREVSPDRFRQLVETEQQLGFTIDNKMTLEQLADQGRIRIPEGAEQALRLALDGGITVDNFFVDRWELPAGAFRGSEGGPS